MTVFIISAHTFAKYSAPSRWRINQPNLQLPTESSKSVAENCGEEGKEKEAKRCRRYRRKGERRGDNVAVPEDIHRALTTKQTETEIRAHPRLQQHQQQLHYLLFTDTFTFSFSSSSCPAEFQMSNRHTDTQTHTHTDLHASVISVK